MSPLQVATAAAILALAAFTGAACTAAVNEGAPVTAQIADQVVTDIDGRQVKLADYKGKVVLVVNVASECGYTPQYAGLEKLYERYKDRGLVVLGFPSNDFGGQEPGAPAEIKQFASEEYGVTFPLMGKVHAKGADAAPIYKVLGKVGPVKWNFTKFLVDREGKVVGHFPSSVEPESKELTAAIEQLL